MLNWRKGIFDSNYQVFSEGQLRFTLNFSALRNSAIATLQSGIFVFQSNGIFQSTTTVLDSQHQILATIAFELTNFKAKITMKNGEQLDWSFQNSWLKRWTINNHKEKQILYNSATGSGTIQSNVDDDILIAMGLFINEYYARLLFLFILICIIVMTISRTH